MSVESAKAFYERMVTDEAFRTLHRNAASDEERREIVLAAGYDFTPEEWDAAMTQISESPDGELSDEQLTAINGGGILFPMYGGPGLIPGWIPRWK